MCAAAALLVLVPMTRDLDWAYSDLVSYQDVQNTWGEFSQRMIDKISAQYTDGTEGDISNYRISVTLIDKDGEHVLSDTRSGEKYVYRKDYIYYFQPYYTFQGFDSEAEYLKYMREKDPDGIDASTDPSEEVMTHVDYERLTSYDFITQSVESGSTTKAYAVAYYIIERPVVTDDYYDFVALRDSLSFFIDNFTWSMIVLALVFSLLLVYEFSAAGYSKDSEGPQLAAVDGFPLDLWLIILIAGVFLTPAAQYTVTHVTVGLFMAAIGAFIEFDVLFFFWLMSLARHAKTKTVVKNLLVCRIASAIGKAAGASVGWATVMCGGIAALCGVLIVILGGRHLLPLMAFPVVFAIWAVIYMRSVGDLFRGVDELSKGDFSRKIPQEKVDRMPGKMRTRAENLNALSQKMQDSIDEQMKTERLKAELIANVSHDIKTPLTSIITYTDLLKTDPAPEDRAKYLEVLSRQSQRLKKLTEDVLESSMASSGNVSVNLAPTSIPVIVDQSLVEYQEKLDAVNLTAVVDVGGVPEVTADGRLLWRALRNLLSNVAKYSAPGTRVYIDARRVPSHDAPAEYASSWKALAEKTDSAAGAEAPDAVVLTIKNTSRDQLNITPDELMQRFVRGDRSRHSEGSGLGLDIAGSLLERMGGALKLSIDGDLFTASVILPEASDAAPAGEASSETAAGAPHAPASGWDTRPAESEMAAGAPHAPANGWDTCPTEPVKEQDANA